MLPKAKQKLPQPSQTTKAPLSACGPEKLWATVISSRLHIRDLEDCLEKLQGEIQKDGIGISEKALRKTFYQLWEDKVSKRPPT